MGGPRDPHEVGDNEFKRASQYIGVMFSIYAGMSRWGSGFKKHCRFSK